MRRLLIIAIDGPSGAGKGTVARTVAARLAYRHIDTGAMYRAVAWKALTAGVALDDGPAVAALAARAVFDLGARVCIDGEDVTDAIRTPEIDRAAGLVAQHPAVREVLVARQRTYGAHGGVVMEGRDIGSAVFPQAEVKVYLDAAPEERARRRAADAAHAAGSAGLSTVAEALEARDHRDRTRQASPLRLAPDAVYIDTTHLGVDDVVAQVMRLVDASEQRMVTRSVD
jgi:cytidylate kinase